MIQGISQSSQVHTRTGILTTAGTLLPAYLDRKTVIIQNLNGSAALFVKFGAGASTSDFDVVLKAGSAPDDGLGGILSYDVLSYTGIITVAGASIRATATEF